MTDLIDIINEGNENFEKINSLLTELIRYYSLDKTFEIRKKILDILLDCQILSNKTVKSLLNK